MDAWRDVGRLPGTRYAVCSFITVTPYFFHSSLPSFCQAQSRAPRASSRQRGPQASRLSMMYIASVTALCWVSDQAVVGTSSKNGPHLLVLSGYALSQAVMMACARACAALLPFLRACSSSKRRSVQTQFVVYAAPTTPSRARTR